MSKTIVFFHTQLCFTSEDTDSSTGVIWITVVWFLKETMHFHYIDSMDYFSKTLTLCSVEERNSYIWDA